MYGDDPEEPPLLAAGFHYLTLSELRSLCVDAERFSLSTRRSMIMDGIATVVRRLVEAWIVGELWVDGSFLTEKINPDDADIVVRCGGGIYNEGFPEQKSALDWIISNLKDECHCDSYHLFEYWPGHPLYGEGEFNRAWYMSRFGFMDDGSTGDFKGIAVLRLPGGAK